MPSRFARIGFSSWSKQSLVGIPLLGGACYLYGWDWA